MAPKGVTWEPHMSCYSHRKLYGDFWTLFLFLYENVWVIRMEKVQKNFIGARCFYLHFSLIWWARDLCSFFARKRFTLLNFFFSVILFLNCSLLYLSVILVSQLLYALNNYLFDMEDGITPCLKSRSCLRGGDTWHTRWV